MIKNLTIAIALLFSLKVSAQAHASASASVRIVDIAGNSFSSNEANSGMGSLSADSLQLKVSTENSMKVVNAEKTAVLGRLTMIGSAAVYSITLPDEPITLSRLSGNELLQVQSLQLVSSNTDANSAASIDIKAVCKPGKAQAAGYYAATAPVDIVINYN